MRNRRKDIVLDFTSLLDVIMIILFFFIIFGTLDTQTAAEETRTQAEQIKQEAEEKLRQAEQTLSEAEAMKAQAEEELQNLEEAGTQAEEYYAAMSEFRRGINLKLIYYGGVDDWSFVLKSGDEVLTQLYSTDDFNAKISQVIEEHGYTEDSYIMLEYIYDYRDLKISADNAVRGALDSLKQRYKHLLVSETDISHQE